MVQVLHDEFEDDALRQIPGMLGPFTAFSVCFSGELF